MLKKNEGLSIHCHHEILIEYCTDYKERVAYIKSEKPQFEQKIRLKLFRLLPQKAINDLPKNIIKAHADWQKAHADWQKAHADWQKAHANRHKAYVNRHKAYVNWQEAYANWQKAHANWQKAYANWHKAYANWHKAYADWGSDSRKEFHDKWCGCKEWNGKEIIFNVNQ